MLTLFARKAAVENPSTNGEAKSHAPRGTTKPSNASSPHPPTSATITSATPTAILLHLAAMFWLKPNTKGERATQIPIKMLAISAPVDGWLVVRAAFILILSFMIKFVLLTWFSNKIPKKEPRIRCESYGLFRSVAGDFAFCKRHSVPNGVGTKGGPRESVDLRPTLCSSVSASRARKTTTNVSRYPVAN